MKKALILFVLATFSLGAYAQELTCLDKLLPFNRYSGMHQITKEEWSDGKEQLDSDGAKIALTFLINSKLLCKTNEVVIRVNPVCNTTISDLPQSNTCFIYTNVGYFVLSRDNGRNVNFIFGKDKRFSDPSEL